MTLFEGKVNVQRSEANVQSSEVNVQSQKNGKIVDILLHA